MNRLIIVTAVAGASFAVAVPAVAGLAGNPSFSHRLPVRTPSHAQVVQFDDRGHVLGVVATTGADHRSPAHDRGGVTASRALEPGDDRGGGRTSATSGGGEPEPGDDGSRTATRTDVDRGPGAGSDDSSGPATASPTEPGDDRGRDSSSAPSSGDDGASHDPGDDHGTDHSSGGRHGG